MGCDWAVRGGEDGAETHSQFFHESSKLQTPISNWNGVQGMKSLMGALMDKSPSLEHALSPNSTVHHTLPAAL